MNVNINPYNRLTGEVLYRPYIDSSNFVNQKYYVKKVYYGPYIKTIVLPLECINKFGNGNPTGIKNTGENETKLVNSRVRSQANCIRKAIHNFSGCKNMSFLTLTYAENVQDIKKANHHFRLFIRRLNYYFSKYKKNKYKDLKYLVAYEYQKKGRIHFHIIFSEYIPNKVVRKCWPYGYNKNLPVKTGTNEFVSKYVAKYIVKAQSEEKSKNIYDLNIKAYRFSTNCTDPLIKVGVIEMCEMELIASLKGTKHNFMFNNKDGYLMGVSIDSDWNKDYFWQMEEYVPYDKKIFRFFNKITDIGIYKTRKKLDKYLNLGKQRYIKKSTFQMESTNCVA
ncbi:rolling circle replication-associated protein [Spiroplasma phoeniceum]|uniref:Spiroplasma plectrovirus-related protein n=1 Tax=Spiroplasma phoeniceum P40 TaxID=1276259 RepID=A0A345DPV5_9MOLU|nr:plectrovirus svts2 rep protein [Spiroplasma phoeniceum]AXF95106.1 spiroplasma plectrovirus-related protein [Spiroplasma phoeniceum P40]AXF96243.1 spiroplasma plectrovirus-related protein [Spiroplasma phoeniceum P40]